MKALRTTAVVYAVGTLLHTADHIRRGTESVTNHVEVAGNIGLVLATIAMTLVFARHHLAPLAAAAVGIPHGLGIAAVHLLPDFGVFSDSFSTFAVGPLTLVAVLLEIGGALSMGIAGLYLLRRAGQPQLA